MTEKRMAGTYEVIHAFEIGKKEIIIGRDDNASPDERFMGDYSRIAYYSSSGKWYKYINYSFTNQNRYIYYSVETYYGYREDPVTFMYEWKKEGEMYYSRLWDNPYDDWEVFNLEYINTDTIIIDDKEYTK